jgi:hypothetical protein
MAYSEGNVNGLWRLKPTGRDHCAIGVEMPSAASDTDDPTGSSIYGAIGETAHPTMAVVGDPFAGKPLT